MDRKTRFCRHENGCLYDALRQAIKQVKYGLIISSILQLIKSLKMIFKGTPAFKKSFTPEYLSIVVFLTSSTFALRFVKCALRWVRNKEDWLNSLIAGMVAGYVGSRTLNKDYWYILLMFVASRIISSVHQSLMQSGILNPAHKHFHYFLLFLFSNFVHGYGYFIEPDILKPDIYNLYERMSVLTPNEKRWHLSSLVYMQNYLKGNNMKFFSNFNEQKIRNLERQIQAFKQ